MKPGKSWIKTFQPLNEKIMVWTVPSCPADVKKEKITERKYFPGLIMCTRNTVPAIKNTIPRILKKYCIINFSAFLKADRFPR
jgi:hypothetical protein